MLICLFYYYLKTGNLFFDIFQMILFVTDLKNCNYFLLDFTLKEKSCRQIIIISIIIREITILTILIIITTDIGSMVIINKQVKISLIIILTQTMDSDNQILFHIKENLTITTITTIIIIILIKIKNRTIIIKNLM